MRKGKRQQKEAEEAMRAAQEAAGARDAEEGAPIPEVVTLTEPQQAVASAKQPAGSHARQGQAAYIQKSARMRKILIAIIILLILLLICGGVLGWQASQRRYSQTLR